MFLKPVNEVLVTKLTAAGVAASPAVKAKQRSGRHTLIISATSAVKYGDKDLQDIAIPAGTSVVIPVTENRADQIYVSGACTICECF